ncbi:DUF1510 family protein, partial [Bacillus pumilus]|uniref:DUF1510 family protein n=2 Tax=Bacillaceae TaxID=186817 RepID=UPI002FFF6731
MSRNSRFEHRDKRRKANMVLNILIGIVVVLILVVATSLLIFNKPKDIDVAKEPSKTAPATSENKQKSDEDVKDQKKDTSDDSDATKDDSSDQDDDTKKSDDEKEPNKDALKDAKETDGGKTSDVDKTYESDDWEPVGTEQSGSHTATYDSNSKDWKEMMKAMS